MIIDGRKIAQELVRDLAHQIHFLKQKTVCFVLFGENTASQKYVELKSRLAKELGIETQIITSTATTTKEALDTLQEIVEKECDGVVVQLPLPEMMDVEAIINSIPPHQDIDVLSTVSKKNYEQNLTKRVPPVAAAVAAIISHHNISTTNKNIVVLGNGRLVGAQVHAYLKREDIRHAIVDIQTPKLEKESLLKNADIIISGIGIAHYVKPSMIQDGVILIDAGSSEQSGKLIGDIDPKCAEKASFYTPVPGGVGPITVACLFQNIFTQ